MTGCTVTLSKLLNKTVLGARPAMNDPSGQEGPPAQSRVAAKSVTVGKARNGFIKNYCVNLLLLIVDCL